MLANQFIDLQNRQTQLVRFANLTQLVISEMQDLITKNDKRITDLFNTTERTTKKNRRSIICLQLFSESIYMIEAVKTSINNFIMADTLLPKGNKNLFSEAELAAILAKFTDYTSATRYKNFWDYSLFSIKKEGNQWVYKIQVPLTNLPPFTVYKVSPFPVFPIPNNGSAFTVDIPEDSSVVLSNNGKYFIDKVYVEKCSYSDTHGICPGPVALIDTDLCSCEVSLLLNEIDRMDVVCNFKPYSGFTPRIATSMGQFIITSRKPQSFIKNCNGSNPSHLLLDPGTSMLTIESGCTLNTSDINLLNPSGVNLANRKLDLPPEPIFRFQQMIKIEDRNLIQPESYIKARVTKLELEHIEDTEFNEHIESNSKVYIILTLIIIITLSLAVTIIYCKLTLITPIINLMRKQWNAKTARKTAPKIANI